MAGVTMPARAQSVTVRTTGNAGLDALADAIAERVFARLEAAQGHAKTRLLDVPAAAEYLSRTPSAIRHMIAKGILSAVRRDGRVYLDRQDLDNWVEMGKTNK
jgi:Helix-turn-helix domain